MESLLSLEYFFQSRVYKFPEIQGITLENLAEIGDSNIRNISDIITQEISLINHLMTNVKEELKSTQNSNDVEECELNISLLENKVQKRLELKSYLEKQLQNNSGIYPEIPLFRQAKNLLGKDVMVFIESPKNSLLQPYWAVGKVISYHTNQVTVYLYGVPNDIEQNQDSHQYDIWSPLIIRRDEFHKLRSILSSTEPPNFALIWSYNHSIIYNKKPKFTQKELATIFSQHKIIDYKNSITKDIVHQLLQTIITRRNKEHPHMIGKEYKEVQDIAIQLGIDIDYYLVT